MNSNENSLIAALLLFVPGFFALAACSYIIFQYVTVSGRRTSFTTIVFVRTFAHVGNSIIYGIYFTIRILLNNFNISWRSPKVDYSNFIFWFLLLPTEFLLAINRFAAINLPMRYSTIFSMRNTVIENCFHNDIPMCQVYIEHVDDPSLRPTVISIFALIYGFEFVLGVGGNLAVLYLTLRNRQLQSVQNMFMMNLALSDLVVCVFSLPITPATSIFKNWYFGDLLCHSVPWLQGTSIFVATFSLAVIAIDRYCLIVKPHLRRISRKNARWIMAILWGTSALITLPYSWYMKIVDIEGLCGKFCTEEWPDDNVRRYYTIFVMVCQFVIPGSVMFLCYCSVFSTLQQRTRNKLKKLNERSIVLAASMPLMTAIVKVERDKPAVQETRTHKKVELVSQTRRNVCVLVAFIVVFMSSALPHNVASVALEFTDGQIFMQNGVNYSYLVSLITHSIFMLNNVANPILYGLLNPQFVEMLKKTVQEWKASIGNMKRLDTMSMGSVVV